MKRMISRIASAVLCLWLFPQSVFGAQELIPVGEVVGLELQNGTVTVAGLDEQLGSSAKAAGLQVGDILLRVDDTAIRRCAPGAFPVRRYGDINGAPGKHGTDADLSATDHGGWAKTGCVSEAGDHGHRHSDLV